MTDLQIFKNEEFGQVRTVVRSGEPWLVGKDVAESLGYADTVNAIKTHVDIEDKLTWQIATSGQNREMTIINESGLYALIFGSRLESAQRFKRWVTSEVLPSIRQNGGYIANQSEMTLQVMQGMLNQLIAQEQRIQTATQQSQQALDTTRSIKDTIIGVYDNWREEVKHLVSSIQKGSNKTFQDTYNTLYDELEKRAKCDLSARVRNGRDRLQRQGEAKTHIEAFGRLDVIEADVRLKEIFTTIVKQYTIKYS